MRELENELVLGVGEGCLTFRIGRDFDFVGGSGVADPVEGPDADGVSPSTVDGSTGGLTMMLGLTVELPLQGRIVWHST